MLFGSAVYGLLPGLDFAPLAAAETGGDVAAVQEALQPVFAAVLVTALVVLALWPLARVMWRSDDAVTARPSRTAAPV